MNKKKLLVCALALSTVGVLSTIDTAGVLPFSAQTVHAEITRTENHGLYYAVPGKTEPHIGLILFRQFYGVQFLFYRKLYSTF